MTLDHLTIIDQYLTQTTEVVLMIWLLITLVKVNKIIKEYEDNKKKLELIVSSRMDSMVKANKESIEKALSKISNKEVL